MEAILIGIVVIVVASLIVHIVWTYISPYFQYKSEKDFKKSIEFNQRLEEHFKNLNYLYLDAYLSQFYTLENIESQIEFCLTKKEKDELNKIKLDIKNIRENFSRKLENGEKIEVEIGPTREERAVFKKYKEFLEKVINRIKNKKTRWWSRD